MAHIICTVTNDLSQDQRMHRICLSLTQAGHKVWLVGRQKKDSLPLVDRPYQQIRLKCKNESGKRFYTEYNWKLFKFLVWNKCDIINAVDLDTILACGLATKIRSAKLVFDAHEYFSQTPEVINRPAIQKMWEGMATTYIPWADAAYTVGPMLAKIMSKKYKKDFKVVRNLPHQLPSSPSRPNNSKTAKKIILYQGMLNQGRGLETAIASMQYLEGFELWLVGHGDVMDALQQQVKQAQLEDKVIFHGFVHPRQLQAYTQQAWVGLNLLENKALSYYYSLANKAFDYIQSGIPSIQMAFPEYEALQEQYEPFALLKNLDAKELASLIQNLDQNPTHYQQLQHNCKLAAQELNWEKEEAVLLEIYDNLSKRWWHKTE